MPGRKKKHSCAQRPAANTTLGEYKVKQTRTRGGGTKSRALKVNAGNFSLQSEGVSAKCTIVQVMHNPSDNDLARRGILTKNSIVKINTAPLAARMARSGIAHDQVLGSVLALITSRPGQTGRADGYVLQGSELEFYLKKMNHN